MIACFDVQYTDTTATAACLTFADWPDARALEEHVDTIAPIEPYIPGQFYRRELPCILRMLAKLPTTPDILVIDGYVHLGPDQHPGLGAHLYHALHQRTPVVGVAKTAFHDTPHALPVLRGQSKLPLYVTAAGLDPAAAADHLRRMHGPHRIPTLLKRVDHLCRQPPP